MKNFFVSVETEEEAKDVFRYHAKVCHPDLGGDAELMTELNRQYKKCVLELRLKSRAPEEPQPALRFEIDEDSIKELFKQSLKEKAATFFDAAAGAWLRRKRY